MKWLICFYDYLYLLIREEHCLKLVVDQQTDGRTEGQTDRQTDGQTKGPTWQNIEFLSLLNLLLTFNG